MFSNIIYCFYCCSAIIRIIIVAVAAAAADAADAVDAACSVPDGGNVVCFVRRLRPACKHTPV